MSKFLDGLQLLNGNRLALTNHNASEPAIKVNGQKLSYADINLGALSFTSTQVFYNENGSSQELLHTNSKLNVKFEEAKDEEEEEPAVGKLQEGQLIQSGSNLFKQNSPAPFCYMDATGRLNSANLWSGVFSPNIMGYTDADKPSTYSQGLVPAGSASHGGQFLRRDGVWGYPSAYTGSVAETFLSLQDTPITYQGQLDKYVRVSYAEGGTLVFDSLDTSKVPENSNLYYTDTRVESKIASKLSDNSITTLKVNGSVTAETFVALSDVRLKENVSPLDRQKTLKKIMLLEPKTYSFKNKPGKIRYGLIAQEVGAVLPDVVEMAGTVAGVNYVELVPMLIAAIQEQQQRIDQLESYLTQW